MVCFLIFSRRVRIIRLGLLCSRSLGGDILLASDSCSLSLLTLLDLSAAFDNVDHDTLPRRMLTSYGLDGAVLAWFKFNL